MTDQSDQRAAAQAAIELVRGALIEAETPDVPWTAKQIRVGTILRRPDRVEIVVHLADITAQFLTAYASEISHQPIDILQRLENHLADPGGDDETSR